MKFALISSAPAGVVHVHAYMN